MVCNATAINIDSIERLDGGILHIIVRCTPHTHTIFIIEANINLVNLWVKLYIPNSSWAGLQCMRKIHHKRLLSKPGLLTNNYWALVLDRFCLWGTSRQCRTICSIQLEEIVGKITALNSSEAFIIFSSEKVWTQSLEGGTSHLL